MISTAVWMYLVGTGQVEYSLLWVVTVLFDFAIANSVGGTYVKK